MQRYQDSVLLKNATTGVTVVGSGLTATIYNAGTLVLASIYSTNSLATLIDQALTPLITDANGNFFFYAPDGRYDITISGLGITSFTKSDIILEDLALFFGGNYADATGTADAITADFPNAPINALADGYPFTVDIVSNNLTTTPTFQPTLKGVVQTARVIVKPGIANTYVPVCKGDLNGLCQLVYDSINLRYKLLNPHYIIDNSHILKRSATPVSAPADTNEDILATITIPGGTLGLNGQFELRTLFTVNNNANAKTLRVRLGGIGGTIYETINAANNVSANLLTQFANRGAANSQVGAPNTAYGLSTSAVITSAVDTSADTTVVITGQKAVAGDTITLESYIAEIATAGD